MRLSDYEASFLYRETSNTPMHSVALLLLDDSVKAPDVQAQLAARIHLIPALRKKLTFVPFNLAHPVWVDDPQFDLTRHITPLATRAVSTMDQAWALVLEATRKPLSRKLPLWTISLVPMTKKRTLMALTVHQALLGTQTALDLMSPLLDASATTGTGEPLEWQPSPTPSAMQLTADALQENTRTFSAKARQLRDMNPNSTNGELIQRATEILSRFVTEPAYTAPWNRGLVGGKRVFRSLNFAAGELRRIKNRLGGTVNDLVLAMLAEAAARYVADQGVSLDGRRMRIMLPIAVRREDEGGVRRNRVSGIFPTLDAAPEGGVERLHEVRLEMESIKFNREAQAIQLLSELAPPLPPLPTAGDGGLFDAAAVFTRSMLDLVTFNPATWLNQIRSPASTGAPSIAGFNFTCNIVPAAKVMQYMGGVSVSSAYTMPMLAGNLGFACTVVAYADQFSFNLLSDPDLLDDLDGFAEHLEAVLTELSQASAGEVALAG